MGRAAPKFHPLTIEQYRNLGAPGRAHFAPPIGAPIPSMPSIATAEAGNGTGGVGAAVAAGGKGCMPCCSKARTLGLLAPKLSGKGNSMRNNMALQPNSSVIRTITWGSQGDHGPHPPSLMTAFAKDHAASSRGRAMIDARNEENDHLMAIGCGWMVRFMAMVEARMDADGAAASRGGAEERAHDESVDRL